MDLNKWGKSLLLVAMLGIGTLACSGTDIFVAQATVTRTRTPRPTFTPIPEPTDTPVPTITPTRAPTATATRPPTARPATARPPTAVPKSSSSAPQPTPLSNMEFHVNPAVCAHSGKAYIKGIVYLDKNDPSQRYQGAIVTLGDANGVTRYGDPVLTEWDGTYTFILNDNGPAPGNYWIWLVTPSMVRKSDIGGPIKMNNLGPDNPTACWAGSVDFWR